MSAARGLGNSSEKRTFQLRSEQEGKKLGIVKGCGEEGAKRFPSRENYLCKDLGQEEALHIRGSESMSAGLRSKLVKLE